MRSLLLMFLLLLSVLIHDAQGRRLSLEGSVLAEDGKHKLHKEEFPEMKSTTHDERENKKWSSAGSIRKLIMIHISSTATFAKNHKNGEIKGDTKSEAISSTNSRIGRKEEDLSVNLSSKTQKLQDTIDVAEMDYTLARRKPPIHN